MTKANQEIRERIYVNRLKNWEVAEELNLSDSRFSVWLRTPLREDRKQRVEKAIDELLEKQKKVN
ncbi:hypothetical protein P7D52_02910 [Enterococcus dongliensis]|uniref:Phage protein n=1 Tax=Enterococcus xiangfangensis TaxID=1296537 RepID=A0ABU3F768_9ENTE|nr:MULTISPECIES: hypothetical protein [Enterococcus]MDT2641768.1 hypothetical protein [Enterococcus dongliensis]MDT2646323.1 hypothetical protein [Enterococcus dongliensis]MDT2669491.1 hypothetical protein [Enterococcus dongliensis]MDT2753389.1 hypothetical protein [Enterococcus pseudoavium]MDT2758502.1 hypothetical protein [Enterococcus xiangfangensis]